MDERRRIGSMVSRIAWPLAGALAGACKPVTTEVDIAVVFPQSEARLAATDNVSLVLEPDGFSETIATEGSDFALEIELDPDNTERSLSIYMAQASNLLAWGRSAPFIYTAAARSGLGVLLGYPGELSELPLALDVPDDSIRAAFARGRGMVALGGEGSTLFFDQHTLNLVEGAPLPGAPARLAAGASQLVADPFGGVVLVGLDPQLSASRFDVGANAWSELELPGAAQAGARAGAAVITDPASRIIVLGGGAQADTLQIDLGGEAGPIIEAVDAWRLDGPRVGAEAIFVEVGEGGAPLVVGGDDPSLPLAWWTYASVGLGPPDWSDARCVQLLPATALCGGGIRNAAPTGDVVRLEGLDGADPTATELVGYLGVPMRDPMWFADDTAVYAQGEGAWFRVDRATAEVTLQEDVALRANGGTQVALPNAAALLVGGRGSDGGPLTRWSLFMPVVQASG